MANLTVKAEYLYARFEGETVSGSFTGGDGFTSLSANLLPTQSVTSTCTSFGWDSITDLVT